MEMYANFLTQKHLPVDMIFLVINKNACSSTHTESPNTILTGSTHVPMVMDVPTDGSQYVPTQVEQSNKKQQPSKGLGEIKTETEANWKC